MKRVEQLIARSRRETENEDDCSTSGIIDQEFVDYLNDAQDQLQSAIARQHKDIFIEQADYDVVARQDAYALPADTLLNNSVSAVFYSRTGQTRDLTRLRSSTLIEKIFDDSLVEPIAYIRKTGSLVLNPTPSTSVSNGLRVFYVKKLPTLDVRRAKILTATTLNNTITSLVADITAFFDVDSLQQENYICTVNRDGSQTMRRIPIDNIDSVTGIITIAPGFVFVDGETIVDGDYIVSGYDATNKSNMSDTCERYFSAYLNWKIFRRDSSSDSAEQTPELIEMQTEIVEIHKKTDDDIKFPAISDAQFIDDDDQWNFY